MVSSPAIPENRPRELPSRRYSTRAEYQTKAKAMSMRTCHSHHDRCHDRLRATATRDCASRTKAVIKLMSITAGRRRYLIQ